MNGSAMKTINVMLIEDHPEYRDVIEIAVGRQPDMELVGKFGAAEVALRSCEDSDGRPRPDIILLDLGLPGMSGLEAISHFIRSCPHAKILVLTQSNCESDVLTAISQGAAGYLLKSSSIESISDGIRAVINGDVSIDSGVAKYLVRKLQSVLPQTELNTALTPRELEILVLVGEGLSKKEIAGKLGISSHTVRTHIVHIYEKLSVPNAPAAITEAYRQGILRSQPDINR